MGGLLISHFFIVGPTASGKSGLALQLAEQTGSEICSMDAFQVYRNLDIGTGKVSREEQARVPHHLLDLVDPTTAFTVADYLEQARSVLEDCRLRRKNLVWVGGTGLYYRALRRGLSPVPASDPEVVRELESRGLDWMREEIRNVDPEWAAGADLDNPRRVVRALAVFRATGRTLSSWHREKVQGLVPEGRGIYICPQRETLREAISRRVSAMWQQGWCGEVQALMQEPSWGESQSAKAIGYGAVRQFLETEGIEADTLASICTETWQYARRQNTWFRSEPGLTLCSTSGKEALQMALTACSLSD